MHTTNDILNKVAKDNEMTFDEVASIYYSTLEYIYDKLYVDENVTALFIPNLGNLFLAEKSLKEVSDIQRYRLSTKQPRRKNYIFAYNKLKNKKAERLSDIKENNKEKNLRYMIFKEQMRPLKTMYGHMLKRVKKIKFKNETELFNYLEETQNNNN